MRFPQQELERFWREILDPAGVGLPRALAAELAAYTGEAPSLALQRMGDGKRAFNDEWSRAQVDTTDEHSVAGFYRDQFVEAYELAHWHSGGAGEELPLNYARAALIARAAGWTRALDFGSGIGSGSLCLAAAGCNVDSADVASQLLRFVDHRMTAHGFPHRVLDLSAGDTPDLSAYDVITCFDVLEHVPDQYAKLRELEGYLKPGGVLLVNLMVDSAGPDHAMHISSAGDRLALIRRTGLVPRWTLYDGDMQALMKTTHAKVRNRVGSWVDRMQSVLGQRRA
jgi:SAM-dependent methyltransferase